MGNSYTILLMAFFPDSPTPVLKNFTYSSSTLQQDPTISSSRLTLLIDALSSGIEVFHDPLQSTADNEKTSDRIDEVGIMLSESTNPKKVVEEEDVRMEDVESESGSGSGSDDE